MNNKKELLKESIDGPDNCAFCCLDDENGERYVELFGKEKVHLP